MVQGARIGILNPNPRHLRGGNRTSALRLARILRRLGHRVFVEASWSERPCALLVALNAWKSAPSIHRFRAAHPSAPLVVVITGTDVYTDGPRAEELRASMEAATQIVVLQELALEQLEERHRAKAVVIHQSVQPVPDPPAPRLDRFDVCVVANLRAVKNPLLAARAARLLPAASRVCVHLLGEILDEELGAEVARELADNPRFHFLGSLPRRETLRRIAGARLLLSTSWAEGGAGVVSEALAHGTPVLSTDIPGARGMLPEGYAGLFPPGDAQALAALLSRVEEEPAFLAELAAACRTRAWITDPAREEASWTALTASMLARP